MTHVMYVSDSTDLVMGEWRGEGSAPAAVTGQTAVDVTADDLDYGSLAGRDWDGADFVVPTPARDPIVSVQEYAESFTAAETAAIRTYLAGSPSATVIHGVEVTNAMGANNAINRDNTDFVAALEALETAESAAAMRGLKSHGDRMPSLSEGLAFVTAVIAALGWLFRLESRISAHEQVCAQRQLQMSERHDATNRYLADVGRDVRSLGDKLDRVLEHR